MSNYLIQSETLESLANAIRSKKGTTDTMTPSQMATEIAGITTVENVEWHQDVEDVRNYIANVNYTGVPYTESSILDYAPNPPIASNTKPIGKTVGNTTYYNNVPNGNTPFAETTVAGALNPLDQVRWINSKTSNMRDLGGWNCDGGTVKYGLLYRSGSINLQDEDLFINQLGINTECDLTTDGIPAFPNKMRYICHTSYAMYSLADTGAWGANLSGIFDAVRYRDPVVFHCSMGADRTGTLACILLGLLGVSQSDVDKDYELTSFYSIRARNGNYQGGTSDWAHLMESIQSLNGNTFRDKCVTFVLSLGFSVSDVNAYRNAMIDGTPEPIIEQKYTVTNNLVNCTTSNSDTQVTANDSYYAIITANTGYELNGATVSITMGGVNITSTAYSNGTISIPSVTGDIIISISAVAESNLKELFDASTATINVRFDSSGNTTELNGNFVTDFIPVSGLTTSEPWRIHIKDTEDSTRFRASANHESILFCKDDKSLINTNYGRLTINTSTTGANTLCKHNDSGGGIYIDINMTGDGNYIPSTFFDLSQVAYIRVCMTYSSGTAIASTDALSTVSITADHIIA